MRSMSSTLFRKSADVPTTAKSSEHALMTALRESSARQVRVDEVDDDLALASPPCLLTYFAQPSTPSTEPWNSPGASGFSTSAMTAMRISSACDPDLRRRRLLATALCARHRGRHGHDQDNCGDERHPTSPLHHSPLVELLGHLPAGRTIRPGRGILTATGTCFKTRWRLPSERPRAGYPGPQGASP